MLPGTEFSQSQCCLEQSLVKVSAVRDSAKSKSVLSGTVLSQSQCCPGQSLVNVSAGQSLLSGTVQRVNGQCLDKDNN